VDNLAITYTQRPDATLGAEVSTLGNIYKFVLDCHAKKEAVPENRPDARKENPNASGKASIPRPS
jgi:hypothetical protein